MKSEYSYAEVVGLINNQESEVNNEFETESNVTAQEDTANQPTQGEVVLVRVEAAKGYPDNLSAMNRLTRDGKAIVLAQGHSKNSFKRNYETGTATYVCQDCGADLNVSVLSTEGIIGTVLEKRCTALTDTTGNPKATEAAPETAN